MPPRKKDPVSPPKRAVRRTRTASRAKTPPAAVLSSPAPLRSGRLLSGEEKRQLILAHAAAREPGDPVQVLSMWAGVIATAIVIAIGWWWAVKPQLATKVETELGPDASELTQNLSQGSANMMRNVENAWAPIQRKLDAYKMQAANEQAVQSIADQVNGTRSVFVPTSTDSNINPGTKQ